MRISPLNRVMQHLLAGVGPEGGMRTDGELMARFVKSRDNDALAALVRRHSSMVWGVCRRLLYNQHDAEDAFQATFLVLVRKAADVPGQAVANWLFGVARQTAVRLRAMAAKQAQREKQVATMPEPTVKTSHDPDLQAELDVGLSRLPDHYRSVLILCDLEGLTRKEAARQLGIPEGSVASRLARARTLLAKRLAQKGIVLSGGSAALLSSGSAFASAPPALVTSTIQVANLLAAGQAAGISAQVVSLLEGVIKAMRLTRIKSVLAGVLVILSLSGIAGLIYHSRAAEPPKAMDDPIVFRKGESREEKAMSKEEKLRLLIDQVLAAHGGEDRLRKLQFTMSDRHSNGYIHHYFVQPPANYRWETQYPKATTLEICLLLPDGRAWWRKHPDGTLTPVRYTGVEPTMDYWLDHVKFFGPRKLLRLRDAHHRVTLLEEEAVIDDQAAVGVEIAGKFCNQKWYFDRKTHLLLKTGGVTYSDYKTFDGIPVAQKEHDGHFEPRITDFRVVERFDARIFQEP